MRLLSWDLDIWRCWLLLSIRLLPETSSKPHRVPRVLVISPLKSFHPELPRGSLNEAPPLPSPASCLPGISGVWRPAQQLPLGSSELQGPRGSTSTWAHAPLHWSSAWELGWLLPGSGEHAHQTVCPPLSFVSPSGLGVPGIIQKSNCLSIQLQSLFLGLDMDQREGRGNGHLDKSTVCLLSHLALPGMSSCTLKAFSMQFLLRYASITCPTPRRASLVA